MKPKILLALCFLLGTQALLWGQVRPDQITFVRQAAQRLLFEPQQGIPLASLDPSSMVGRSMYPVSGTSQPNVIGDELVFASAQNAETSVWFGGFNPFATYTISLGELEGSGQLGFRFTDTQKEREFRVSVTYTNNTLTDAKLFIADGQKVVADTSIYLPPNKPLLKGKLVLQMLGSGLTFFLQDQGLPQVIAQSDFSQLMDLRAKEQLNRLGSYLYVNPSQGSVRIKKVSATLSTGVGLADIRAMTYENGDPLLDQGRLWYTMSIRGRALPQHLQGVFSMDPTVFDLRLEGIIVFDRNDGLLRNEIASHIFYDRNQGLWRGLTTGFSAYADPKEHKQLLAVESKKDPRFGFSVMRAQPFGMVGDIEDPHILYDAEAQKWRMLTCENQGGYKAIVLESDQWNQGYTRIAGPVAHNSTGTSIQKIGGKRYCFSGSSEGKIFIYSYPDLKEVGTLKMDLPPWNEASGTRVWPNVVELPEDYPFTYVALMMDRDNYPGLQGPNWSYGAVYLYHGSE